MGFPASRPRRLRSREAIRRMVRETRLTADQLILPLFVKEGKGGPVPSMPGVSQLSIDQVVQEAREAHRLGIPAILLFGIPKKKDEKASEASQKDGIVQKAVRTIKDKVPEMVVMTDVCLCEYMSHGHCGIVRGKVIDNDATLDLLAKTAVSHAEAGADIVAPSDMMDGRVAAIRRALDGGGHAGVPIMSYAVKYASAFYGPFREAAESSPMPLEMLPRASGLARASGPGGGQRGVREATPRFGDRKSYQMDPANVREAIREARLDAEEGADIIMVKPALAYLDVIAAVRCAVNLPIAAYNVSGEYAMIKAAAEKGWVDEKGVMMETLLAIRRSGADLIVTYFAKDAAKIISG